MTALLKQWFFTFLVTLLLLTPLTRALSQPQTPEDAPTSTAQITPEPTPQLTPEATAVVVVPQPPADSSAADFEQLFKIAGLIIAGIIGGSLATIGGVIALVRTVRSDPEKMALIERLYDSRPDEARARIRGGVDLAKEFVAAADEATDGVPLGSKPPAPPLR